MDSYRHVLEYLFGLHRHGIKLGLDPTRSLLKRLGNPHHRYRALHIGGTNGKGSTAAMAARILQAAGYRVGLYTSPHLVDFRERIRVQGIPIPEVCVEALTATIKTLAGKTLAPTFFEFTTALAFQYFAEEGIDIAVVEVGMGGRYDATNLLDPLGVAITNVALDHEEFLGETVAEIAFEKAGIIKKSACVVLGSMPPEASQVIEPYAVDHGSQAFRLDAEFRVVRQSEGSFRYEGLHWNLPDLACSLSGDHQGENAACALALLETSVFRGMRVPVSAVREGLSQVVWEGRLERIATDRQWLVDGAHNPHAAKALRAYLQDRLRQSPGSRVILVVGMMQDKRHSEFLEIVAPLADHLVLTQASLDRAASVTTLWEALPPITAPVDQEPDLGRALHRAARRAGPQDVICVTGSLVLVGEARAGLLRSPYVAIQG